MSKLSAGFVEERARLYRGYLEPLKALAKLANAEAKAIASLEVTKDPNCRMYGTFRRFFEDFSNLAQAAIVDYRKHQDIITQFEVDPARSDLSRPNEYYRVLMDAPAPFFASYKDLKTRYDKMLFAWLEAVVGPAPASPLAQ